MNADLYDQFIHLNNSGRRDEAKAVLDLFISSAGSSPDLQEWVFSFLENGQYGHKIRHEIYEKLIYPVVLEGYLKNDAKSVVWLARTFNNLAALKKLYPDLENKGKLSLLKEGYSLEPNQKLGAELLTSSIKWFNYAQHEWPAGILYGMDGASREQCGEILEEIEFARTLDTSNSFECFLDDFRAKVIDYSSRL